MEPMRQLSHSLGIADQVMLLQTQPAAHVVKRFAKGLEGEEREAAANYLRQWPDGPQIQ